MSRSYCFTLNNYDQEDIDLLSQVTCRYLTFGEEVGESGTQHLQGYIEFAKTQRMAALKKIHKRIHWETRRGTREQAREYCHKDGDFQEFGSWEAGGQGSRNDLHMLMGLIKKNTPIIEIMEAAPKECSKSMRFVEKYRELIEREDTRSFRKVTVDVLVGAAGTGKTKCAFDECPKLFTVNSDESFPFNGYDGEDAILIDDFYGGVKYNTLLRVLDGHQYRVNVKGGHRFARWTRIFITSNRYPSEWYKRGLTDALRRRLSSVSEFRNDEGGNTRTPIIV